jgi:hypothetical protein
MKEPLKIVLYLIFLILGVAVASVVIRDGSQIMANTGAYIVKLFH